MEPPHPNEPFSILLRMALFEVLEPDDALAVKVCHLDHRSGRRMGAQVLRDAHEVVVRHGVRLHERLQDVKLRWASRIDLVTPKH
eukprot:182298-Prymnesium_polylepis.1